jgi:hypothetical protein
VTDTLLPLSAVTDRLRILGQSYAGMQTIPIGRIVGSVDRAVDFDRLFRPRRRGDLKQRMKGLREAFADKPMPPISVYEASGLYFVSDGHHRVALARADGAEFIDAEVTALRLSNQITADVDLLTLVHTQQHHQFMDRTQLDATRPEVEIEFSRPVGYWELTDFIEAHGYDLSGQRGEFVPLREAAADWYDDCWLGAQTAIDKTGLRKRFWFKTQADLYLWVHQKLRELRTIDRSADWQAAADARDAERVSREHEQIARRERRKPLPRI